MFSFFYYCSDLDPIDRHVRTGPVVSEDIAYLHSKKNEFSRTSLLKVIVTDKQADASKNIHHAAISVVYNRAWPALIWTRRVVVKHRREQRMFRRLCTRRRMRRAVDLSFLPQCPVCFNSVHVALIDCRVTSLVFPRHVSIE